MTEMTEGNLRIVFPDDVNVRKFDDPGAHGLTCMKAVDFVVEEAQRTLFIEFKDPEHPEARRHEGENFIERFHSGRIDEDLKYKYRDSFLYEWACDRVDKPIYYLVLVALGNLKKAELLIRTDSLKAKLPVDGPKSGKWQRPIVSGCAVFNIETWNRNIPAYPVERI